MDISSKIDSKKIKKLPTYLLWAFVTVLVIVSLIIASNNLMEYVSIKQENQKLEIMRDNKLLEIDELKYYINTAIDDEYKERMARLLGYCFPDEFIYYVE